MSTSYYQAVIPIDGDTYCKQRAVVDACKAAGVPIPDATVKFFDDGGSGELREVTELGVLVSLDYGRVQAVDGDIWNGGVLVDLAKLPPGTTKIRISAG